MSGGRAGDAPPAELDPALALLLDEPADELGLVLRELRWLVVRHPIAAQAALRALVREGRRYAATPEGEAWRARLAGSELVRRGTAIWELGTLGALDAESDQPLPTQLIDAFARAAARLDLEEALAHALDPEPAPSGEPAP